MITASNHGTIKHFPAAELRRVAEEGGVRLVPSNVDQGNVRLFWEACCALLSMLCHAMPCHVC